MSNPQIAISIEGMSCGGCVTSVQRILEGLAGVTVEHVEIGQAKLSFAPAQTPIPSILSALERAGFEPSVRDAT